MTNGKKGQVTVEKISTAMPGQIISIEGKAPPGERVQAEGVVNETGKKPTGQAAPDGKYGLHAKAPDTPGEYSVVVSVESTGETTSTTFAVKERGSGPKPP